jgi:hypothetical protein
MSINPNPGLKGYTELRNDFMHLADELNKKRLELIEIQKMIGECTLQLVLAADHIFTKSLTERDVDGNLKKEFKTDTDVQSVADFHMPSRRNCGLCRKPGHTAANCPEAHTIQEEKKEVATLKNKRAEAKAALKGTGKRACSNCHQPGHRAKNCPEPVVPKRTRKGKK